MEVLRLYDGETLEFEHDVGAGNISAIAGTMQRLFVRRSAPQ
jgi:hypothetical protein